MCGEVSPFTWTHWNVLDRYSSNHCSAVPVIVTPCSNCNNIVVVVIIIFIFFFYINVCCTKWMYLLWCICLLCSSDLSLWTFCVPKKTFLTYFYVGFSVIIPAETCRRTFFVALFCLHAVRHCPIYSVLVVLHYYLSGYMMLQLHWHTDLSE